MYNIDEAKHFLSNCSDATNTKIKRLQAQQVSDASISKDISAEQAKHRNIINAIGVITQLEVKIYELEKLLKPYNNATV